MRTHAVEIAEGRQHTVALDVTRVTLTDEWTAIRAHLLEKRNDAIAEAVGAADHPTKEFWRGQLAVIEYLLQVHAWELWKPKPSLPPERERIKEIP